MSVTRPEDRLYVPPDSELDEGQNGEHPGGRQGFTVVPDRATELAAAEQMRQDFGAEIRFNVNRGQFYFWTGTHWAIDETGLVVQKAKSIAREADQWLGDIGAKDKLRFKVRIESAGGIAGMLKLFQSEPGVAVVSDQFDTNDYVLNCINGTVDLKTGRLLRHNPKELITHCLSTPFDPAATCPLWESVVARALPDEALAWYFQRWCGLFLTGSPNVHELLIAYGSGANSKSVLFDTMTGILETYAGVAPESLLIVRNGQNEHPTEIAGMVGKRLIVASETESGATLRIQLIKRLTGDAMVTGRFMRQDYFTFRRTWKLVLITNNRPKLTENTEAVWRRLRLLPFDVVIPPEERDPRLLDKLKVEWPGILAWCVRGFQDLARNGMNPPPAVLVATNEYRDESDVLAEFITARCITGEGDTFRASRLDLWAAYTSWTKSVNERHPLERNQFYEAVRRRDGIQDGVWKAGGQAVRGFKGIGLAAPGEEGYR